MALLLARGGRLDHPPAAEGGPAPGYDRGEKGHHMSVKEAALLAEALQALDINVPIYDFKIQGDTITLWLYGRFKPIKYTHPAPQGRAPAPQGRPSAKANTLPQAEVTR